MPQDIGEFLAFAGHQLEDAFGQHGVDPTPLDKAWAAQMLFAGAQFAADVVETTITVIAPEVAGRLGMAAQFPVTLDLAAWDGLSAVTCLEEQPVLWFPASHVIVDVNFGRASHPAFRQITATVGATFTRAQVDHPRLGRIIWQPTHHRVIPRPLPIAAQVSDDLLRMYRLAHP